MDKFILYAEDFQLNILDEFKWEKNKHSFPNILQEIILGQVYFL